MDNPKPRHELEQEITNLKISISKEKLERAEELLKHRLVFAAIIFVIAFIILCAKLEDISSVVQWLCFIVFFGVVFIVTVTIFSKHNRDIHDA